MSIVAEHSFKLLDPASSDEKCLTSNADDVGGRGFGIGLIREFSLLKRAQPEKFCSQACSLYSLNLLLALPVQKLIRECG